MGALRGGRLGGARTDRCCSSGTTATGRWPTTSSTTGAADGKTLPGALDIEYNPYGATCYGLGQAAMVGWIRDFLGTYHARTGRYPAIYSTFDWWSTCAGNSSAFASLSPFWIARYSSSVGSLPAGTPYYTFWQYSSSPIDQNYFNGDLSRLQALASS